MSKEIPPNQWTKLGHDLHQRMLDGDVTAPARIAELFMPVVTRKLRRKYPNMNDPHLVDTAVEDAILNYFARPEQYNPVKLGLLGYLRMSAEGDLRNLLQGEEKEADHLRLNGSVELDDSGTEHRIEVPDDFDLQALVLARNSPVWELLGDILPDAVDQEIVLLMMDHVRETSAFAEVLGILDLSTDEQAAAVKRHKDRLKKKLQRNLSRSELDENE